MLKLTHPHYLESIGHQSERPSQLTDILKHPGYSRLLFHAQGSVGPGHASCYLPVPRSYKSLNRLTLSIWLAKYAASTDPCNLFSPLISIH